MLTEEFKRTAFDKLNNPEELKKTLKKYRKTNGLHEQHICYKS